MREQTRLAFNYAQFIPVLLDAIKELAAQNERLKTEATHFEQRLRALEAAGALATREALPNQI